MMQIRSMVTICRFGGKHGWGHITRCSALNECARSMGWETELCTPSDPKILTDEQRLAFTRITRCDNLDSVLGSKSELDIVLVDEMYELDSYYAKSRSIIDRIPEARLVALDDMGTRSMRDVHLVINTELGLTAANYESNRSLLGERYALVRSAFSQEQSQKRTLSPDSIRVLIMIGGTDPFGWTEKVLESLSLFEGVQFAPVIVSGDGGNRNSLVGMRTKFSESEYEVGLSGRELANWISRCHFGVIGCGSSVYEFAAMNCRFIGICVVDNQVRTARKIETEWELPVVFGDSNHDFKTDFNRALSSLLKQLERPDKVRYSNVDCLGPRRVMEEVEKL